MKALLTATLLSAMSILPLTAQIPTSSIKWDEKSLIFDGKRVAPVMGEIHYSRLPEAEWSEEIAKMKESFASKDQMKGEILSAVLGDKNINSIQLDKSVKV